MPVVPRRPARRLRTLTLALSATVVGLVGAALVGAGPATAAATAPSPTGLVGTATQDTFTHQLHVGGWAYDRSHPGSTVVVRVYADGRYVGQVRTAWHTPRLNAARHLSGTHGFALTRTWTRTATTITVRTVGAGGSVLKTVATHRVAHTRPSAGTRIVTVAKRYVGHARYAEGGASPRSGFDCSGYTQYVFAAAQVGRLPHNAEAQRRMSRMHRVSAAHARPGDLVFYGVPAYHVAIYAGHGMQYAAATPRDGIRYQHVWSSSVQYGHYS